MTLTYVEFNRNVIRTAFLDNNEYTKVGNTVVAVGKTNFFDGKTSVSLTAMDKVQPLPDVGAYVMSETKTLDEIQEMFKQDVLTLAKERLNSATEFYNHVSSIAKFRNKPLLSLKTLALLEEDKLEYEVEKRTLEENTSDDDASSVLAIEEISGKLEAYDDIEHAKDKNDLAERTQLVKNDKATYIIEYEREQGHKYSPVQEYETIYDDGFEYAKNLAYVEGYLGIMNMFGRLT